jgi:hypothetical protein
VFLTTESESATGLFMYKTLDTVMTAMDVLWKSKVVGISIDGASAMTGWSAGLASRVVEAASSECYRVWCMAHQFNLCVKAAGIAMSKPPVGGVPGFGFVGHVSSLIGILRRQLSLHFLTGKCPRFLEVRWSTLCVTLNWLNERIQNNHLQVFLAGRGMSW